MPRLNPITRYWHKYYQHPDLIVACALCGGTGEIIVAPSVVPYNGHSYGGKYFCICPNGQNSRRKSEKNLKEN